MEELKRLYAKLDYLQDIISIGKATRVDYMEYDIVSNRIAQLTKK